MADDEQSPIDQLIDLFVYAPVGLLYEYEEVIPKLVKRGKSQVQLARFIGQVAVKRGDADPFTQLAEGLATLVARQITDIGAAIGLAPPTDPAAGGAASGRTTDRDGRTPPALEIVRSPQSEPSPPPEPAEEQPLPIARYDELKAKEIVALLDELDAGQLARIRAHEEANRARKTVLGKLDRLTR